MKIITAQCTINKLRDLAKNTFVDLVKAVVDVEKKVIAVDAEMHSDLETFLLDQGSKQQDLWGINVYVDMDPEDFVEFDSMINLRPSDNNMTRSVDNESTRKKILEIVRERIKR